MSVLTEVKEHRYIEGPVNFIYLVGDPGDNVTRKILLLGDYHERQSRCKANRTMSLIRFFRYVAERVPVTPDLFVESPFHANDEDKNPVIPSSLEGHYLSRLLFELRDCLIKNKSYCREPMRVHYVDTRLLREDRSAIAGIYWYLLQILDENYESLKNIHEFGFVPKWPRDVQEMNMMALRSLAEGRLTQQKLDTLDLRIRNKFRDIVLDPAIMELTNFYRHNNENFQQIKIIAARLIRTNTPLTTTEKNIVTRFHIKIVNTHSAVMDAYFVCRALKRATRHAAERYDTLKVGQAMTHIMGYTGAAHAFGIKDILLKMGFEVKNYADINGLGALRQMGLGPPESKILNQCLPYSFISNTVDDFCGNEEEEEEPHPEFVPFKPRSKFKIDKPEEDEPKIHLKIYKSKPKAKLEEEEELYEEEEEEPEEEEELYQEEDEELEEEED